MLCKSDNWLLSVPVFLATSLWKKHGAKCGMTIKQNYSQGQNTIVSIVRFDDKVFPAQTICICDHLKPKSENKNKIWINKLWRKLKRIFDFLPFLISWQLTSFWAGRDCLTCQDCPAQGGLKESCRGQGQETSMGRKSSTFQQIRPWKCPKHLDT